MGMAILALPPQVLRGTPFHRRGLSASRLSLSPTRPSDRNGNVGFGSVPMPSSFVGLFREKQR
jgi:hypothetical protein